MPPPKLTADQLRRIEEIEEFQRAADHLKHLVTELEGNRAGQTRTIQQLSEKIANAASQMRQRALTANVGTIADLAGTDRKSTRLNSSHSQISYAVFCLKKKKHTTTPRTARAQPHPRTPTPAQMPHHAS